MKSETTVDLSLCHAPANDGADLAPPLPAIQLADGAVASLVLGALELRDKGGRLLIRYVDGRAEIAAPSGDLVLSAPHGRVVVRSAEDVEIEAARDVVQRAGRSAVVAAGEQGSRLELTARGAQLKGERVAVEAREAKLDIGVIATVARRVSTEAEHIALKATKYELLATKLVERSKDAFRDVSDLAQTRVGRARTIVATLFTLKAARTVLQSKDDTSIDGRKILLG